MDNPREDIEIVMEKVDDFVSQLVKQHLLKYTIYKLEQGRDGGLDFLFDNGVGGGSGAYIGELLSDMLGGYAELGTDNEDYIRVEQELR